MKDLNTVSCFITHSIQTLWAAPKLSNLNEDLGNTVMENLNLTINLFESKQLKNTILSKAATLTDSEESLQISQRNS